MTKEKFLYPLEQLKHDLDKGLVDLKANLTGLYVRLEAVEKRVDDMERYLEPDKH